jgi:hypothetical protein
LIRKHTQIYIQPGIFDDINSGFSEKSNFVPRMAIRLF